MATKEVSQEVRYSLTVNAYELVVIKDALRALYHSEEAGWAKAGDLLTDFAEEH